MILMLTCAIALKLNNIDFIVKRHMIYPQCGDILELVAVYKGLNHG